MLIPRKRVLHALFASLLVVLVAVPCWAAAGDRCKGSAFNPVTDIAWNGLFPIKLGGVALAKNSHVPDSQDDTGSPVCLCEDSKGMYLGLSVSFWEIAYLGEAVNNAWCSPTLGISFSGADNGFLSGTNTSKTAATKTFKQVHWLMFPVFRLLGLLTDMPCLATGEFAYATMTEFSPIHNNPYLGLAADPKAFLFANPAAVIACSGANLLANAPAETLSPAYDALFWCWWDTVYPLTGDVQTPHDLTGAAQNIAREIFVMSQAGAVQDNVRNVCGGSYSPIPKKSQWRFQIAKPVKGATPFVPGQSELTWGSGKKLPYAGGNYMFVLFNKKRCCLKLWY